MPKRSLPARRVSSSSSSLISSSLIALRRLRRPILVAIAATTFSATAFAGAAVFDKTAALDALKTVDLAACKSSKQKTGEGHVRVTFETSGKATQAEVNEGPLVGTKAGECVANQYMKTRVPAFSGNAVRVGAKFKMQ